MRYEKAILDIEIYRDFGDGHWAQAKYLVHGLDDILWTNNRGHALSFLEEELVKLQGEE